MTGERKEAVRGDLDALQCRLVARSEQFKRSALKDGRGGGAVIDASVAVTLAVIAREIRDLIRPAPTGEGQ